MNPQDPYAPQDDYLPDDAYSAPQAAAPIYVDAEPADDLPEEKPRTVQYRGTNSDPTFGYLIGLALSIGLLPLNPESTDLRYVLVWSVLALFGVMAWLMGNTTRIERETPLNLGWGIALGIIVAVPLLSVGGSTLTATTRALFHVVVNGDPQLLTVGSVFALLVFAQPLAETLFFRGVLHQTQPFWIVGILASVWTGVLYLPMIDMQRFPGVALILAVAFVMMNMVYSYVRHRNGLAAAWVCQIVVNLILLFFPFATGI